MFQFYNNSAIQFVKSPVNMERTINNHQQPSKNHPRTADISLIPSSSLTFPLLYDIHVYHYNTYIDR